MSWVALKISRVGLAGRDFKLDMHFYPWVIDVRSLIPVLERTRTMINWITMAMAM